MGVDKATLDVEGVPCAVVVARALAAVAAPVLEVGPGRTGLARVVDDRPPRGPLAALAAGAAALHAGGHRGGALVVACDLPVVTADALRVVVTWPGHASVVPEVDGRLQPLCARWSPGALASAGRLVAGGARRMRDLLASPGPEGLVVLGRDRWPAGLDPAALADVDTPADLDRLGISRPTGVAAASR